MDYLAPAIQYAGDHPYLVVLFGFFLLFFAAPLPEEVILFTGAYLAAKGGDNLWIPTLISGIAGVVITDYWYYFVARRFGRRLLDFRFIQKLFPKKKQNFAFNFVRRFGVKAVFFIRFVPGGFRNAVFMICGLSNIKPKPFIAASLSAACITTHVSFWAGYYLSSTLPPIEELLRSIERKVYLFIVIMVLLAITVYLIKKYLLPRLGVGGNN